MRAHQKLSESFASKSYDNGFDLIAGEDVEAVVVAVSLTQHFELVEAAIELGKHVYCEWPLTADSESATRLRDLATDHDVQTIVGLQAGRSRPVCEAGRHVASGDLGEVLGVTMRVDVPFHGESVAQNCSFLTQVQSGANLLTISLGHAIDVMTAVVGPPKELSVGAWRHAFPQSRSKKQAANLRHGRGPDCHRGNTRLGRCRVHQCAWRCVPQPGLPAGRARQRRHHHHRGTSNADVRRHHSAVCESGANRLLILGL